MEEENPETTRELHETSLYQEIRPTQWPIIYSPEYNIGFLGLEKLHPFDAGKWGKVYGFLKGLKYSYLHVNVQINYITFY